MLLQFVPSVLPRRGGAVQTAKTAKMLMEKCRHLLSICGYCEVEGVVSSCGNLFYFICDITSGMKTGQRRGDVADVMCLHGYDIFSSKYDFFYFYFFYFFQNNLKLVSGFNSSAPVCSSTPLWIKIKSKGRKVPRWKQRRVPNDRESCAFPLLDRNPIKLIISARPFVPEPNHTEREGVGGRKQMGAILETV